MRLIKLLLIATLCLTVSACGMGPFLIKRSVSSLEDDMAKELKAYADFNDAQEAQIEAFSKNSAHWIKSQRLPVLKNELIKLANDIQQTGQLQEQNWHSFVVFLEDPFVLDSEPNLLESMSSIIHSMDSKQSEMAIKKLNKDFNKETRERSKTTAEDQLDSIMSGLKTVFKDLGIARSKSQLSEARNTLSQRKDYLNFYQQNSEKQVEAFTNLLMLNREAQAEFHQQFLDAWTIATASPRKSLPENWQHNFVASYSAMNDLLQDLDPKQRIKAASKIRKYADLFGELSIIEK